MNINREILYNLSLRQYIFLMNLYYYLCANKKKKCYNFLSQDELRLTRRSDTVFICGCGYSLNYLSKKDWDTISQHDTVGTNWFVKQNFVRLDYQIFSELMGREESFDPKKVQATFVKYRNEINKKCNANAILIKLDQINAMWANRIIAEKYLPQGRNIFGYKDTRGKFLPPSSQMDYLVHGPSSLILALNFAYTMNWKKIIFVGVDLYDRRYFWLSFNETRDIDRLRSAKYNQKHNTSDKVLSFINQWIPYFKEKKIELFVQNPKSLLTRIIPEIDISKL